MGEHRATIPLGCVWRCFGLQTVGVGSAFLGMGLFEDDIICIFRIHVEVRNMLWARPVGNVL